MGSPDFSVPVLQALVDAGHEILCVYTQPPRPAGRGKKDRPTAVHAHAAALNLPVRHPETFKSTAEQDAFAQLRADLAVVVAYGLILPQAVLDAPTKGCLNIHASLLPRWRGAAPIHRAIMAGDAETGVCIMQMEAGLDTGPVLMRRSIGIGPEETTGSLHDRLSALGAQTMVSCLQELETLNATPQAEVGVSYAHKIDKAEARINWGEAAVDVDRKIRGLSPAPGAWCEIAGERVKLLASRVVTGTASPGTVLEGFQVACGQGAVEIKTLQKAGKRAVSAEDFLRGTQLPTLLD